MNTQEKTLDLTMFNRRTWEGRIRLRYLFDWAHDYWGEGFTLSKVKLSDWEYKELLNELRDNNVYIKMHPINENLTIDCGHGIIEIQRGDNPHR